MPDPDFLWPLHVAKTQDEFGTNRYFVEDSRADWIGEPYDTCEQAAAEIDRLRQTINK